MTDTTPDVIDTVLDIVPGSHLDLLRRERSDIRKHIQGSHASLFAPTDSTGLSLVERLAVSHHVARLNSSAGLESYYAKQIAHWGGEELAGQGRNGATDGPRLGAILNHAALLTQTPDEGSPSSLDRLVAVGLSTRAIVVLSQLIGYVNFQTRLVAGLALLRDKS